jgi:hypothetical protein
MSSENQSNDSGREISPVELFFSKSPYSVITLLARVRGSITEAALKDALAKLQQAHLPLQFRITEDENSQPWFTTEGTREIPCQIIPRNGPQDWIKIVADANLIPYQFETHPALKVILMQSEETCELVLLCHHVLADGLSLAYLMRDLLELLGDPGTEMPVLPVPTPISLRNMPDDIKQSGIAKFFMGRINRKWTESIVHFDQEDYQAIAEAFWSNYNHPSILIELTESETTRFIDRCREENTTVNSALTTAFLGAVSVVIGEEKFQPRTVVAADLRDRIPSSPGEAVGVYAGGLDFKFSYDHKIGFWENTRSFHTKANSLYTNKNLFNEALTWSYLHPTLSEAMTFKKLGSLVPSESPKHEKLFSFSQRDDVVSSILKREKLEDFESIFVGTAITNLTRLDFPVRYGEIELERIIFKPGGAFPLSNIHVLIGAVTCVGKLSLIVEYSDRNFDDESISALKEKALFYLLQE